MPLNMQTPMIQWQVQPLKRYQSSCNVLLRRSLSRRNQGRATHAPLVAHSRAPESQGGPPRATLSHSDVMDRNDSMMDAATSMSHPAAKLLVMETRDRLAAAIKAENAESERAVKDLYLTNSQKALAKDGLMLLDLNVEQTGSFYNDVLLALTPTSGKLRANKFSQGKPALLTMTADLGSRSGPAPVDCTVIDGGRCSVSVAVAPDAANAVLRQLKGLRSSGGVATARLDLAARDPTAHRQLEALKALGNTCDEANEYEIRARMLVLGHAASTSLAQHPARWAQDPGWRGAAKDALTALYRRGRLNKSQSAAIAASITRTFSLWQGPPGTGKTATLVALMQVLVAASESSPQAKAQLGQLLVSGGTNACADNLAAGAAAAGLSVARVGNPARVDPSVRHLCAEALAEHTVTGQRAAALRQQADALAAAAGRGGRGASAPPNAAAAAHQRRVDVLWRQAEALLSAAVAEVLAGVQVVCCTCTAAGAPSLPGLHRMVIIDEATQATEAATVIPLVRGAECVVLAGDPQQLPPTVVSEEARRLGLDQSLMERRFSGGMPAELLRVQYRMHPGIADFPSRWFYAGKLRSGVTEADRPLPAGLPWPKPETVAETKDGTPKWTGMPVVLVDASGGREGTARLTGAQTAAVAPEVSDAAADGLREYSQQGSSRQGGAHVSYANKFEAVLAVSAAHALCAGGDVRSVALLTPYRGQVRAIEAELAARSTAFRELRHRVEVSVSSVDGYQGKEADAVVFSVTRNNQRGALGFVSDPRRMNVAITRPRNGLVVIGAPNMLENDKNWGRWLNWCRKYAAVVPPRWLPAPPWSKQSDAGAR
eukprot:jgi/Ulvmu1/2282/UM013_0129.1